MEKNLTGEESVYTTLQHCEVMFHVATLLPFKANDTQQVRPCVSESGFVLLFSLVETLSLLVFTLFLCVVGEQPYADGVVLTAGAETPPR